jgi:hypothetical protein
MGCLWLSKSVGLLLSLLNNHHLNLMYTRDNLLTSHRARRKNTI